METTTLLGGLALLMAFLFGCCVFAALRNSSSTMARRTHARSAGSQSASFYSAGLQRCVRHGVRMVNPLAEVLLEFFPVRTFALRLVEFLEGKGLATTPVAITTLLLVSIALLVVVIWLIAGSLWAGFAVVLCVLAVAVVRLNSLDDKRVDAMREAVPDAFRSMEACFQSGLSLMQTLQQVASESTGPLKEVFARAAHRLEVGGSTKEALLELKATSQVPELAFAAVALDVQHQAGGSLRQVLEAARESVEGQLALRRSLRVQTAQAKLSARVVSVMPFVLIALFSLVSEGFLDPFFKSMQGICLLGLAFVMQGAGILIVRKMLAVDLD